MSLSTASGYAVAAWPLDEASGNRIDTISSRVLTDVNTVGSAAGLFGNAASFTAASSERLYNSFTPPTGTMSVSFWIKTASNGIPILTWDDNNSASSGVYERHFRIDGGGTVRFYVYDGSTRTITSTATVDDDAWHLIVGVIDGEMRLYIDGTEQSGSISGVAGGYNSYSTPFLVVGTASAAVGPYYQDELDELVVLDGYGLSDAEVSELWNSGTGVAFADWAGGGGGTVRPRSLLTLGCGC